MAMRNDINWIADKLKTFCKINQFSYISFIRRHKLGALLPSASSNNYSQQLISWHVQKQREQLLLQCMIDLRNSCDKLGIDYAFLKGLALATDLYALSYMRSVGDIDILVNVEDVPVLLRDLAQRGFKEIDGSSLCIDQALKRVQNGHHHLTAIKKRYYSEHHSEEIEVEIHVTPTAGGYRFYGWVDQDLTYTSELLSRTRKIYISDIDFSFPGITDTLYTLALHLTSHICIDLILYLYMNKPFTYMSVIRMTIDIVLHLTKYSHEIDWDYLGVLTDKYCSREMLVYVIGIIYDIYGVNYLPEQWKKSNSNISNSYSDICIILSKIPITEYVLYNNLKANIDLIVKKRVALLGDCIPQNIILYRDAHRVKIQVPLHQDEVMYCVDIYNTDLFTDQICSEYIIVCSHNSISVYKDNGYRQYWDPEMCKDYGPDDIWNCYVPVNFNVHHTSDHIQIELSEDCVGFVIESTIVSIKVISSVNPFISKKFI